MPDKSKQEVAASPTAEAIDSSAGRLKPVHLVRIVIASAVIAIWVAFSVSFVYSGWLKGTQLEVTQGSAPSQTVPYNAQAFAAIAPSTGGTGSIRDVLQKARTFCPQYQSLLMVSDAGAAYQLADYFIYPRTTISIGPDQPFGQADLAAHAGGCIVNFGQQSAARLTPFKAELTQVICSSEGCLYMIGKGQ